MEEEDEPVKLRITKMDKVTKALSVRQKLKHYCYQNQNESEENCTTNIYTFF